MVEACIGSEVPDSLWIASRRSTPPPLAPLAGDCAVDVAVIGGGFTGLSAALHAAEAGANVGLLERETVGFGASGRNGGQVNPGLKSSKAALMTRFGEQGQSLFHLADTAPDFLAALVERKSLHCQFERHGLIRLAHNQRALKRLYAALNDLKARGVDAEALNAQDIERRVGTRHYCGGYFDSRGGSVHPLDLAHELARAAKQAGAQLYAHSPALAMSRKNGRWQIATPSGRMSAAQVLIGTNAYSDELIPGLAASLLPVNSFQIATEPLPAHCNILPGGQTVYDSRRLVLYFRRTPDNRLMMGGRASFSSSRTVSARVADYSVLEQVMTRMFPQIKTVRMAYRWTGLVGITLDHLPHYHIPAPSLHVAVGFNGRGVALATRVGALLGRKLAGKPEPDELPATPIRPVPFHDYKAKLLHLGMQWNRVLDMVGM